MDIDVDVDIHPVEVGVLVEAEDELINIER